ncbi:MAG: glycine cleavage system protein GcvH [Actinobacteria bacterium]|nr:glycine cleavage system protein GcvH [Actinomycetota bacterium]
MATARNCNLPDDLHYVIEKHVWARTDGDLVTVGITDVAQNLAKTLIAVTPKKVGRAVRKGQNVATVESGKFVGPVPAPVSGEIVEVNQAVIDRPSAVNDDPYGAGWIARLRPTDWAGESGDLATGPEGLAAYEQFLEREGISCEG